MEATRTAKRRQRVHRPCDRAPKEGYLWEPTSSASCTEGSIESPFNGQAYSIPPGSKSRACAYRGSPGTWEIPLSPVDIIRMGATRNTQPPARDVRARRRAERRQAHGRYRPPKATKGGGTDSGKSEHRIVLLKRGNSARGRPRGRKAMPNHGTDEGPHAELTDVRERVHETTSDSGVCEREFLKRRVRNGVIYRSQRSHDSRSRMR